MTILAASQHLYSNISIKKAEEVLALVENENEYVYFTYTTYGHRYDTHHPMSSYEPKF